jgi:DNA-binding transcriptional ArsR family regulator
MRKYAYVRMWDVSLAAKPHPDDPSPDQIAAAATSFSLLADPTRIRILWALRSGPADVGTLAAAADCQHAAASQHLGKLRLGGLVDRERQGRRVVYRLRGGHVRKLLEQALFHADHQVTGAQLHD